MKRNTPPCNCSMGGNAQFCECQDGIIYDVEVRDHDGTWSIEASFWTESAAQAECHNLRISGDWLGIRINSREV
jgi:hypothetical protein